MPRTARVIAGGVCYHVINRGNARQTVFHRSADYRAFLALMRRAAARDNMRSLAYCLMPNHFHFVLWPHGGRDLSRFMHWLLTAHVARHRHVHKTTGHIWQGRFKVFPIEEDRHLLTVMRYVERNPVRAGLVASAADWSWSSASTRLQSMAGPPVTPPPVPKPSDWLNLVNTPQNAEELEAVRRCGHKSAPYGSSTWVQDAVERFGLESAMRGPGRPQNRDIAD